MSKDALQQAASKIKDGTLRANAEALLEQMSSSIEGIGDRDLQWRPSILKVVQAMADLGKLPKGTKVGDMILGDTILGDSFPVIPLRVWDSRLMWDPDTDVNEIVCQSPDAKHGYKFGECSKCPHSQFGEGGSACNKQKNFIVVAEDLSEVFQCSFSKSAFAMGLEWEGIMRKAKTHPYKRKYSLSTESHPKYKKVQVLNAHVEKDAIDDDVLGFLEVLFNKVSQDRAESIERFYEGVQNRQQRALESKPSNDNNREPSLALEVKEGEFIEGTQDEGATYKI